MEEFKARRKYDKTVLILTFGLPKGSLGKPFCANPCGFADKTAIATLAQSGRLVSAQNKGIQGAQEVLPNRTHIDIWALRGIARRAFLLKSIWFY